MEDSKLQALHDSLSKLRSGKGLGSSSQYSWQRIGAAAGVHRESVEERSKRYGLPNNPLYAYFVPEGAYNAKTNDRDGRVIKRDFSYLENDEKSHTRGSSSASDDMSSARRRSRELRKAEKKAAAKAAKLEAKKLAKLEEKKRLKKEAKKLMRTASSLSEVASSTTDVPATVEGAQKKGKKKKTKKRKGIKQSAGESTALAEVPEPLKKKAKKKKAMKN